MMIDSMEILKNVSFSQLKVWDVKSYFRHTDIFNPKYPVVLFGDFLSKPNIEKTKIEDEKEYKILGVRSYGKGAFINRNVKGNTLKMKTYQVGKKDHLFWCKVDTKNGAFGIIDESLSNGVASSNMTFAKIELDKANPQYVQLLFQSKKVNHYMDGYVTGTTNRKYIKPDQLRNEIKIPLPPFEEQNRIVANYNAKIKSAKEQEQKAKALEQEIENYLFEVLGIEKLEEKENKVLNFVNFSNLNIWGVDRLLRGNFNSVLTSSSYPNKKLNDLVYVNPKTDLTDLKKEDRMSFIPMKYVSDNYGIVLKTDEGKKENSKGYTKFQDGDLIWSRITPCMQNGKSAIVSGLLNGYGYGSTEYHVLREKDNRLKLDFLYHLLRSKLIRKDAVNHFTGSAGQQRVPKTYLENLTIPLPPLKIQTQIANHITALKQQIKDLQTQAKENRAKAILEFEEEIFTKS